MARSRVVRRLTVGQLIEELNKFPSDLYVVGQAVDESQAIASRLEIQTKSRRFDPSGVEEGGEYVEITFG